MPDTELQIGKMSCLLCYPLVVHVPMCKYFLKKCIPFFNNLIQLVAEENFPLLQFYNCAFTLQKIHTLLEKK